MALSHELVSEFVRVTKDEPKTVNESTVYGTVKEANINGNAFLGVQLDGSDIITPVMTTAEYKTGERVAVSIKNHTATVTGNASSPAAHPHTVIAVDDKVNSLEVIVADEIKANEAAFGSLIAKDAEIINLVAGKASIEELNAEKARIDELKAGSVTTEDFEATNAKIDALEANNVTVNDKLSANEAAIKDLQTSKLSATDAEIKYANIDFANIEEAHLEAIHAKLGIVDNITFENGTLTGELVGVTIKGDLIEGNTIKADKLVVKGSDGLYYKLNFEYGTFKDGEPVPEDSLHGSIITAKSVTAEKVSVSDLVAFDATIGGFKIEDNSIHSVVKESVNNTTRGIYLDNDGQMAVGDGSNFIKYYQETPAYLHFISTVAGGTDRRIHYDTAQFQHLENTTYTLSFKARSSVDDTVLVSCVAGNEQYNKNTYTLGKSWKECSVTYTTSVYGSLTFWLQDANTDADITDIKLVKEGDTSSLLIEGAERVISCWTTIGAVAINSVDAIYKLAVSADSIVFGNTNVESAFNDRVTRDEFNSLEIGGRNLIKNSDFSNGTSKWTVGPDIKVEIIEDDTHKQCLEISSSVKGSANCRVYPHPTDNFIHTGGTYSLSFYAKASVDGTKLQTNVGGGEEIAKNHTLTTDWEKYTFTYEAYDRSLTFWPVDANSTIYIAKVKVEKGDKCTDWTIAPEDIDDDIGDVNNHVSDVETNLASAQSVIEKLRDAISMLVTDGDGTTLLQQTTEGWKFNLYDVQNAVTSVSTGLNDLTNEIGDVNNTVNTLNDTVKKLDDISEYVDIIRYQDVLPHLHIETAYNGNEDHRIHYQKDANSTIATNHFTHLADTVYTLSFKARSSVDGTILVSCVGGSANKQSYVLNTDWQPYSVTYTTTIAGSLTFWLHKANTDADIAEIVITKQGDDFSSIPIEDSSSLTNWVNVGMKSFTAEKGSNIEPCIELGEGDSDFKLMITNTRIMFKDGHTVPTYINTRGLVTKNIEVKGDFNHSGFVWAKRANGNYGLSWKGDGG